MHRDLVVSLGLGLGIVASAAALATCAPRTPTTGHAQFSYTLTPPPDGSWLLKIEATFEAAPSERFVAPESSDAMTGVVLVGPGAATTPLPHVGDAWFAPACRSRCTVRYEIALDAVAASCHRMDCDRRVGDAIIGRASTFMLRPEPMGDALVHVRAAGPDVARFATGLRRDRNGAYVFATRELGEASFTAFGAIRRTRLTVAGAQIELALLGPPLAMGDQGVTGFVAASASCVAGLFGRFPVDATIFVVPVHGRSSVVFGRVMSLAGASVALLVGDETPASSVHDEWVVVHELFHLGTPSFVGEGRWLEEGLATYYEPVARERAGWMTETDLWSHFVREMPRGLRSPGDAPDLEDRDDTDATYWGGALFALLADVNIRTASQGARSLDDVLRAVLDREGDATHASRLVDFLRDGDAAAGNHELTAVYASWAVRGENPDLDGLWKRLGISGVDAVHATGGRVDLHDDAPWAAVRKAIGARFATELH
jgi:predicted metalloprotease with PDZ domain